MNKLLVVAYGLSIPAAFMMYSGLPAKENGASPLVINEDVVINGSLTIKLTNPEQMITIHAYKDGQLFGTLQYGHPDRRNELGLIGFRDPPKVLLASDLNDTASFGAVSFNKWDGETMREAAMLIGDPVEGEPNEMGGQIRALVNDPEATKMKTSTWSPSGLLRKARTSGTHLPWGRFDERLAPTGASAGLAPSLNFS